jgi:hypothetical protein
VWRADGQRLKNRHSHLPTRRQPPTGTDSFLSKLQGGTVPPIEKRSKWCMARRHIWTCWYLHHILSKGITGIYKEIQSILCLFPLLPMLLLPLGLDPPLPEKRLAKTRPAKAANATPEAAPILDLGTDVAKSIPSVEALRLLPPPPIQEDSGELWNSSPSSPFRGYAGIPVSTVTCKYTEIWNLGILGLGSGIRGNTSLHRHLQIYI